MEREAIRLSIGKATKIINRKIKVYECKCRGMGWVA